MHWSKDFSCLDDLEDNFTEGILTGIPQDDSFILPSRSSVGGTSQLRHLVGSDNSNFNDNSSNEGKITSSIEIVDLTSNESSATSLSNFFTGNGHQLISFPPNQVFAASGFEKGGERKFSLDNDQFSRMRRHNIFIKYVGGFMPKENAFFPGNDTDCFHQDDDPRIEEILGLDSEQTATTTALNNRINERRKSEPATTEGFKVQENEIEQRLEPATSTDICNERVGVPFGTFGTTFQVNPAPATLPFQPNATSGHQETVQAVEQLDEEEGECLICGANAGRHIHYGGQSCYSCKAFFRRAVIDNTYHNFKCTTKTCSIDSKSWRSCKWCRFQKCLASGLKPSWVLEKKERKRRHATKVTFVTRAHQSDNSLALGPATAAGGSMIWGYSADELSQLIKLANGVHSDLTKNLLNFYGNNPTLFSKVTG